MRKDSGDLKKSTQLLVNAPEGSKFTAAKKWKLPAVSSRYVCLVIFFRTYSKRDIQRVEILLLYSYVYNMDGWKSNFSLYIVRCFRWLFACARTGKLMSTDDFLIENGKYIKVYVVLFILYFLM